MVKILVVDSSNEFRSIMHHEIMSEQHSIVFESNLVSALEQYSLVNPDIVFLELSNENSMGLNLLKKLRQRNPSSKIIMLIANEKMNIIEECLQLGALAFISQPFTVIDILSAISFVSDIESLQLN